MNVNTAHQTELKAQHGIHPASSGVLSGPSGARLEPPAIRRSWEDIRSSSSRQGPRPIQLKINVTMGSNNKSCPQFQSCQEKKQKSLTNPSQEGCYNSINPLVKGVPPNNHRPPSTRWRPVNMWGKPLYYGNNHVVSFVPPHIHRPQIFRCLCPGPHLFPCSSMHWTTVFCIVLGIALFLGQLVLI